VRVRVCSCGCTGTGECLRACSLTNLACNAPPYCDVIYDPSVSYHIFRHYLLNGAIFKKKKVIEHKMRVLIFSTSFVPNISHSETNSASYCHKCEKDFVEGTRYSCRILFKLEFSRQVLDKGSNIKFHQTPSSGSQVVHEDGQTRRG
jgi:hypothetical protein